MTIDNTLFPLPASPPPALARLRAEYAEALAEWQAANEHEDESGEAVPREIIRRRDRAEGRLRAEEARQATPPASHCDELGVPFADLPPIDLVLQSHDHYDHFDDWSVRAIARAHPEARWYAPLFLIWVCSRRKNIFNKFIYCFELTIVIRTKKTIHIFFIFFVHTSYTQYDAPQL